MLIHCGTSLILLVAYNVFFLNQIETQLSKFTFFYRCFPKQIQNKEEPEEVVIGKNNDNEDSEGGIFSSSKTTRTTKSDIFMTEGKQGIRKNVTEGNRVLITEMQGERA